MRIENQGAPEVITAAIFNRLEGPGANPVGSYEELEADEAPAEALQQWSSIQEAVEHLPASVRAGLTDLLGELDAQRELGRVEGLVRAARIAQQRLQMEQARDLLIEAGIKSADDLQLSGADGQDIYACLALFRDWSPSQEEVMAAIRRNQPTVLLSTMFKSQVETPGSDARHNGGQS